MEKGSITVDGISLTVSGLGAQPRDWFEVSLIPTTRELTTLGSAPVGTRVNLEVDVLAKYVERLLPAREQPTPEARRQPRTPLSKAGALGYAPTLRTSGPRDGSQYGSQ
ncbi:lumazine binding domain protein [Mycobacterium kansasii]|uniref:Riboflavin synthase n=1 Tax=Mycobacterium kansasii TaxID=1768 RepID=A0A1V3WF90_MYCKA|nr:lumazine binding domain protein [Mycobacterium kansasii]